MPHSGGGGSSSGGCSSSSSGGGSYSGGSSRPAMSKTYYSGATRYVYYYDNKPHTYYADKPYNPKNEARHKIFFAILWLLFTIPIFMTSFKIQSGKLPLNYDSAIYIEDNIGIINNKDVLTDYLEDFREQSGVSVSVITESLNTETMGTTCENKAYNRYVDMWDDESHWLIYYMGDKTDRSDDWQWNLMCGDDCVKVLSTEQENKFTEEFHRRLVASNRYPFEDCIIESLKLLKINTGTRLVYKDGVNVNGVESGGQTVDLPFIAMAVLFIGVGIVLLINGIKELLYPSDEQKAQMNAIEINRKEKRIKCEYCGRYYYKNSVVECPYCGAPVNQ